MKEKVLAVVLAAGSGSRMQSKVKKQYLTLGDKPVLVHTLLAFEQSGVDEIMLVVGKGEEDYVREDIVEAYGITKVKKIICGGRERFDSSYCAIKAADPSVSYIMIQDGARAFITKELIDRSIADVKEYGTSIMAVPSKDTIKVVDQEGFAVSTPDRSSLWLIQTPQTFLLSEIRDAYDKMMQEPHDHVTDDAMVMEHYGSRRVKMTMGSYENIKITTPDDLILGQAILKKRAQ